MSVRIIQDDISASSLPIPCRPMFFLPVRHHLVLVQHVERDRIGYLQRWNIQFHNINSRISIASHDWGDFCLRSSVGNLLIGLEVGTLVNFRI